MAKRRQARLDSTGSFGRLAGRIDAVRRERQALAADLRAVMRQAQDMLADVEDTAVIGYRRARKAARKSKRRLSPEGRANIIAAAKKRWARYHAAKKK